MVFVIASEYRAAAAGISEIRRRDISVPLFIQR
jgi:hypothetical protein